LQVYEFLAQSHQLANACLCLGHRQHVFQVAFPPHDDESRTLSV